MAINKTEDAIEDEYSELTAAFNLRYRVKKIFNLSICFVIAVLGVTSFLFGIELEPMPTIFRWMTVDGTLFTTIGSIIYIVINLIEVIRQTEMTRKSVYFIRLSCAVAESVILVVVISSQMPFFSEHIPLCDRYDSFVMHIMIPILGICSFGMNDSPIGVLKPLERWHGTWFVTCYVVVIFVLIGGGVLPDAMIPYFFLDYRHYAWATGVGFAFIYCAAYLMSWMLSVLNRKLSWLWFKDVMRIKNKGA